MTFAGIIYAEQLWVLSEVLERHCDAANIKPGTPEYESEGVRIVALYENGARTPVRIVGWAERTGEDRAGTVDHPDASPVMEGQP